MRLFFAIKMDKMRVSKRKPSQNIIAWRVQAEAPTVAQLVCVMWCWDGRVTLFSRIRFWTRPLAGRFASCQRVDGRLTGVWTCVNTRLALSGQKFGLNTCMSNVPLFIAPHNLSRGVLKVHIEPVNRDEFEAFYGDTNDAVWAAPASQTCRVRASEP